MTAFAQPIDAETWAFIERTNAHYPPETIDSTIAEQRAVYDRMCREFFAGYPAEVTANDSFIDTPGHKVPIRVYAAGRGGEGADGQAAGTEASARHGTSTQAAGLQASVPAATVLYFHGGGFVVGGLDSHDDVCAELCGRTGYAVVSVDYRLAPEHAHPAQFDDAMAAFGWVLAAYEGAIVLAGDSAGGNLAAAVSHAARQRSTRMPAGQVLIYPGLGGDETKGSYIIHAEAPMLTARDVAYYRELRAGGADVAADAQLCALGRQRFFRPAAHRDRHRAMRSTVLRRRDLPQQDHRHGRAGVLARGARPGAWLSAGTAFGGTRAAKLCRHRSGRLGVGA